MKNLLLLFILVLFVSCESKWNMNTYEVKEYYLSTSRESVRDTTYNWIFEGTREEAEAKEGITREAIKSNEFTLFITKTTKIQGK